MWGRLTVAERRARRVLLWLILTEGRDPGLKAIASRLEVSESTAAKLLSALERKGFLVRDRHSTTITAAYPLSTRATPHRVMLIGGGQQGYGLCAIDALGVGPAFRDAAIITANCPHCGRSIAVHVEENQVVAVEPRGTVVWYSLPELLTKRAPTLNLAEAH